MFSRGRLGGWLCLLLLAAGQCAFAQESEYHQTIPPEVLRRFDPAVVEGTRPHAVTITQEKIWDLRENPNQGGEVYLLDMDYESLSTVQKNVLINWVRRGAKVLLWGKDRLDALPLLVPGGTLGWSAP